MNIHNDAMELLKEIYSSHKMQPCFNHLFHISSINNLQFLYLIHLL